MKILIIHGPNLNLLGRREPETYGDGSLEQVNDAIRDEATKLNLEVDIHQTAREGEIIELLHAGIDEVGAAIVNPAAYSHTSRAIAEAIRAVPYPVVEVHMTNIHAREPWRRRSVTAEAAHGIICGFGAASYLVALGALRALLPDD